MFGNDLSSGSSHNRPKPALPFMPKSNDGPNHKSKKQWKESHGNYSSYNQSTAFQGKNHQQRGGGHAERQSNQKGGGYHQAGGGNYGGGKSYNRHQRFQQQDSFNKVQYAANHHQRSSQQPYGGSSGNNGSTRDVNSSKATIANCHQQNSIQSLKMTPYSTLLINNDPSNMSHLSEDQKMQVFEMQKQVRYLQKGLFDPATSSTSSQAAGFNLDFGSTSLDFAGVSSQHSHSSEQQQLDNDLGFDIFLNKQFNKMRMKYKNLSAKEINVSLWQIWNNQMSQDERSIYQSQVMSKVEGSGTKDHLETRLAKIDELKGKIQQIQFPFSQSQSQMAKTSQQIGEGSGGSTVNPSEAYDDSDMNQVSLLKPSGKLKFKSAQRFFRMEMVPILKKLEPQLDGQGRQEVIKELWQKLQDHHKLAYVLLSRADREKTLYVARLNQIREELRQAYPQEYHQSQQTVSNLMITDSSFMDEQESPHSKQFQHLQFNDKMHGIQALDRIEERIMDEVSSDVEDSQSQHELKNSGHHQSQLAQDTCMMMVQGSPQGQDPSSNSHNDELNEKSNSHKTGFGKQALTPQQQLDLEKKRQEEVRRVSQKILISFNYQQDQQHPDPENKASKPHGGSNSKYQVKQQPQPSYREAMSQDKGNSNDNQIASCLLHDLDINRADVGTNRSVTNSTQLMGPYFGFGGNGGMHQNQNNSIFSAPFFESDGQQDFV